MKVYISVFLLVEVILSLRQFNRPGNFFKFPAFYHSAQQITNTISSLAEKCKHEMTIEKNGMIDIVTITPSTNTTELMKGFFLFGEHARELVSPETAIKFLADICQLDSLGMVMKVVPIANPTGHELVEKGDFCRRTNFHGVDINRNWQDPAETNPETNFKPDPESEIGKSVQSYKRNTISEDEENEQTNPGPHPFSEEETHVIKEEISRFKPDLFVSVHSGTRGIYTPWANAHHSTDSWFNKDEENDFERMKKLASSVDDDHCNCPLGGAQETIGYSSTGTCIDWIYSNLKTRWVYAFEIFSNNQAGLDDCFGLFNPKTEQDLDAVTTNWSKALIQITSLVLSSSN